MVSALESTVGEKDPSVQLQPARERAAVRDKEHLILCYLEQNGVLRVYIYLPAVSEISCSSFS